MRQPNRSAFHHVEAPQEPTLTNRGWGTLRVRKLQENRHDKYPVMVYLRKGESFFDVEGKHGAAA